MHDKRHSRYTAAFTILFLYLFPLLLISSSYLSKSWDRFSLGLLVASFGTCLLFLLLFRREKTLQYKEAIPPSRKIDDVPPLLESPVARVEEDLLKQQEFEKLKEEVEHLELDKRALQKQLDQVSHELEVCHQTFQEQSERKETAYRELQQALSEQRAIVERHQQHISILETKERDLHYEIKTLLQLATTDPLPPEPSENYPANRLPPIDMQVRTPESASQQLKRCLDIAAKMNGSYYFGNNTHRFKDLSLDHHALDLRHLCDTLRGESSAIVVLYSQKEHRLLFANNVVRDLLGWSPEKFIQSFADIIQNGEEWQKGLNQLATTQEVKINLVANTKNESAVTLQCHLGMVYSGSFRHHSIAVMYPHV